MKLKKILSLLLSLCVVFCAFPSFAFARGTVHEWDSTCKTHCRGNCGHTPVIVVPGIMQSQTYVQDCNGNDIMTSDGFPIVEGMDMSFMFDTVKLTDDIKAAVPDILKAIIKLDRTQLFDILLKIFDESFSDHYFNPDGTRINPVAVDEYWYSLEECKNVPDKSYNYAKGYSKDKDGNVLPTTKYEYQYDFIVKQINIEKFCEIAGYDHAYYYAYASFGNILESAANLNEYIDMVKAQTGHSKVSLVFVSLGGTIANVYLSKYIDKSEIDKIIFAACAVDGSYLLSDLMDADATLLDGNVLYNELIPNVVKLAAEEYMSLAYLGNTIARVIPQEFFSDFLQEALERALDEVLGKLIRNCQSTWALVPSGEYERLAEKYISDEEHTKLKEMTDEYYNIQRNAKSTIQTLDASGVDMFVVTGYNLELPAAVKHYKQSSDQIIHSVSSSVGATFAPMGKTFDENYKPSIDASYISPEKLVDAGTCALPDKTWFVKNQSHLELQSAVNDTIGLCVDILVNDDIKDARVNNGGYPQFTEYRDLSTVENLIYRYNKENYAGKDKNTDTAYEKALDLLANKVWSQAETTEVEKELYTAMKKAKMLPKDSDSPFVKYDFLPKLTDFFKFISDIYQFIFRDNDYWLFYIPILR